MTDVASASFVGRPVHWLRYGRSFLAVRLNQRSSRLRPARPQRRSNGPEAGAQIDDHRIDPAAGASLSLTAALREQLRTRVIHRFAVGSRFLGSGLVE